jgi:hypothetical protein
MADQPKDNDAQRQLELMQKMLDDAAKILGDIHKEVKARRDAQRGKSSEDAPPQE